MLVRLKLAVLLAAGMFSFVACMSVGVDGSQREYVEGVSDARKQLFQGHLGYTDAEKLGLVAGKPQWFRARVIGDWHTPPSGDSSAEVRAGAQIGVRLQCSGAGVVCTPISSERQNVLTKSDRATWMWRVTAKRTGKVALALTVTAYYRDTNTVLFEKPVTALAEAAPAPDDSDRYSWLMEMLAWVKSTVVELGLLAGALAAVWGLYVGVTDRRHSADEEGPATAETGRDASQRPRAESPRRAQGQAASAGAACQDDRTEGV
ncbi:hypothetical protein [Streptomyces olindensis]|uniref:hypothetical protein n=1 Tax=Streptomyces olindensis TaxID=358823 RepID=UPI00340AC5B0